MTLSAEQQTQVLDCARDLIRVPSLTGQEAEVIAVVQRWMQTLGYQDIHVDMCGNIVGMMGTGSATPLTLIDSHVDVVPANGTWVHPPFAAEVSDGRLYGRGATDMKGPFAASLCGVAYAAQLGALGGMVAVSASVGEEDTEGLCLRVLGEELKPGRVVICESTGLRLNHAQRGRAELFVRTLGRSAHASTPQMGINALRQMCKLIAAIDTIQPPTDPQLGAGILEPTEIISVPYPSISVLPSECQVRYDRRLLVGEYTEEALAPIRAVIAQLAAADPTFAAQVEIVSSDFTCYTGYKLHADKVQPAWRLPADHEWVRRAQAQLQSVGQAATLGHYSFCTNGSYTMGIAGIPTVGYGPGREDVAHIADEWLDLAELYAATEGYAALAGAGWA